jgi:hypothetical protein
MSCADTDQPELAGEFLQFIASGTSHRTLHTWFGRRYIQWVASVLPILFQGRMDIADRKIVAAEID